MQRSFARGQLRKLLHVSSQASIDDCKALCAANRTCAGVEFGPGGRCEVWSREIQATREALGYTCLKAIATPAVPRSTTVTPGAGSWQLHKGLNCYSGNGADIADGDLVSFDMTLEQCQAACHDDCEGVVVVRGEDPGRCWLRKNIKPASCVANTPWDMWLAKATM